MDNKKFSVVKKIEPDADQTFGNTTELKNVVLLLGNQKTYNATNVNSPKFIGNSDGNLEISTIKTVAQLTAKKSGLSNKNAPKDGKLVEQEEEYIDELEIVPSEDVDEEANSINDEVMDDDEEFMEDAFNDDNIEIVNQMDQSEISEDDLDEDSVFQNTDSVIKIKEEAHPCPICERIFKTAASLKRHVSVNHATEEDEHDDPLTLKLCICCAEPLDSAHTTGDFKCEDCGKLFTFTSSLQRHRSVEHSKDGWRCVDCNDVFASQSSLIDHMKTHPFNKVYVCRHCGREFTRKYHLERHLAQTGCDGKPRNAFECQVCKKIFSRKDNLREHLRAHVGQSKSRKIFECTFCTKEFRGSSLLVIHLRTHTGERPYPCEFCDKRFPSSGAMRKHRRMHTGEKPYQCSKCSNTFAAKETLNRHFRTHTGEKPHACHFCGKTFIQAAQLRAHIFHHTGENAYTCSQCNRAFNRRNRLTQHIKFVHEGEKPLSCDSCDRTFYRKEDLIRHNYFHTGERPYQCELCEKRFTIKSSLKLHMLTHRKEEPCSCDECGRAFIRQDCLMRHMRAKHRDVLEDIMAGAEKKRLQQQLLNAASDAAKNGIKLQSENSIWSELSLTDSVKELLSLLVDESTLTSFGWPDARVDKILDAVIKRCGHKPASEEDFDYLGRMRENVKLLFTVVIDDEAVKSLLNNQTVDEVILHVLRLAKVN